MFFTDAVILHAGEVADLRKHSVPSITSDKLAVFEGMVRSKSVSDFCYLEQSHGG